MMRVVKKDKRGELVEISMRIVVTNSPRSEAHAVKARAVNIGRIQVVMDMVLDGELDIGGFLSYLHPPSIQFGILILDGNPIIF